MFHNINILAATQGSYLQCIATLLVSIYHVFYVTASYWFIGGKGIIKGCNFGYACYLQTNKQYFALSDTIQLI